MVCLSVQNTITITIAYNWQGKIMSAVVGYN